MDYNRKANSISYYINGGKYSYWERDPNCVNRNLDECSVDNCNEECYSCATRS